MVGLLSDNAAELEELLPRAVVSDLVDEQLKTGARGQVVGRLLGMVMWRVSLRQARRESAAVAAASRAAAVAPRVA